MTTYKTYAQFNSFTVNGRILASEIVSRPNAEFLSVTLITAPADDSEGMTVTFTNSNGLMKLAKAGGLPVGRMITMTGHIASVHETYTNKDGEIVMLKRPRIHMIDVAIPTGGLGATPRNEDAPRTGKVVIKRDATPVIETKQEITPDMPKEEVEALF
tara:strand:- start:375 stop:848 length:474 start_codon:yes stop_codon:yes gene_type:complete